MPFTAHFSVTKIHPSFKDTPGNTTQSLYHLAILHHTRDVCLVLAGVYVCMCVYMCIWTCVCMYVCMYIFVCMYVCVCSPQDSYSPVALRSLLALISPSFPISFPH